MKANDVIAWVGVGMMLAGLVLFGGAPSNIMGAPVILVPSIGLMVVGLVVVGWAVVKSRRAG